MVDQEVMESGERGIYYGWVIVFVSFVIMTTGMGMVFTFGVFLKPIQEQFFWSRAAISLTSTINWAALGACSLLFGFLSDRIGTRKVVLIGGLVYGIGLLLSSRIEEPWHLYITFGVMTGIGTGSYYVPLSAAAMKWFDKRRGVALAIVTSGSGVGVLIFAPFSRFLINAAGWRWAFIILGLTTWGIVIPLSRLLRNAPTESETIVSDDAGAGGIEQSGGLPAGNDIKNRVGDSIRTPSFRILTLTHFLCCLAHSGLIVHLVAFTTDAGVAKMTAAAILGLMGISSVASRIGAGHLADRLGPRRTLSIFLAYQALVIFTFILAKQTWSFYLASMMFGVAFGSVMPIYALISREYFGPKILGTIYGTIFMVSSIGMGLGGYFGGLIFDITGNYKWLFIIAGGIGSFAAYMAYMLKPPGVKEIQGQWVKPELTG